MTTQLKNQNPLDPLDTNQFTQQLVQFASVEQQLQTNDTLASLLKSTQAANATSALGFVGTEITADGATSRLTEAGAQWRLTAPRAGQAAVTITNSAGSVVATDSVALQAGAQTYNWNGRTSTGLQAPAGDYTITVTGRDATGQGLAISTEMRGIVDSVDLDGRHAGAGDRHDAHPPRQRQIDAPAFVNVNAARPSGKQGEIPSRL